MLLNKKNVGEKANNKDDINAIFLSNNLYEIRYVNIIIPIPNNKTNIFPKNTTSKPSFQNNPNIKGQISGLNSSYKPISPPE